MEDNRDGQKKPGDYSLGRAKMINLLHKMAFCVIPFTSRAYYVAVLRVCKPGA